MLGHITVFVVPGCRMSFTIFLLLITAHFYPSVRTRGGGLLNEEVVVFMVATWFAMISCP